jgi:sec-independent protein translocase protein TatA
MFGYRVGTAELLVILGLALVIFGPQRLPEIGRSLGRGLRDFKKAVIDMGDEDDGTR